MLVKLFWIAVAGGLGTLARYGLAGLVQRFGGGSFPWGTLAVNSLGCLMFGAVWAIFEARIHLAAEIRLTILVGFMGAFTTFSTYLFETGSLLQDSEWMLAAGNLALQNVIGLACLFAGLAAGRYI